MIEKIKIKYNNLNGSSYIQSNISSNQDGQSYLKERLNEQFLRINDEFMLYINEIFKNKLINDDDLISYNFLKYKEIDSFNILDMINLLIDDKNYHNQLLNDSNNIRKINCLLNYSRQNFIPNQITDLFISHFYENTTDYCKINIDNIDIENFQKYYEYIDIENKYCLMLFDKLSLYFESYDNNQKMILEDKNIMTKEGLIEQLSDMVDILFEKKNFLIYIYILQKYFKKDDIYYKSITDYYFTDYNSL